MKISILFFVLVLTGCAHHNSEEKKFTPASGDTIKAELLSLEKKWLEAEFNLDTAYIAGLLDPGFIGISADKIGTKQQELKGMYDNISNMRSDSIFLDSLRFEDARVNIYDNSAVVTMIVHTYKKDKRKPVEKRTRFYDVWIKREGGWKAVSSQGTVLSAY